MKTVRSTLVNLRAASAMVTEYKLGQMAQNTKDSGKIIKLMVAASSTTLMVTFSTVNGSTIRLMALAPTSTPTVPSTKEHGSTTCRKARARRPGKMDLVTRVLPGLEAWRRLLRLE